MGEPVDHSSHPFVISPLGSSASLFSVRCLSPVCSPLSDHSSPIPDLSSPLPSVSPFPEISSPLLSVSPLPELSSPIPDLSSPLMSVSPLSELSSPLAPLSPFPVCSSLPPSPLVSFRSRSPDSSVISRCGRGRKHGWGRGRGRGKGHSRSSSPASSLHGEVVEVGGKVTVGAHPLPLPLLLVRDAKEVEDEIGVEGMVVYRLPFLTACIPRLIFLLSQGIPLGPL